MFPSNCLRLTNNRRCQCFNCFNCSIAQPFVQQCPVKPIVIQQLQESAHWFKQSTNLDTLLPRFPLQPALCGIAWRGAWWCFQMCLFAASASAAINREGLPPARHWPPFKTQWNCHPDGTCWIWQVYCQKESRYWGLFVEQNRNILEFVGQLDRKSN